MNACRLSVRKRVRNLQESSEQLSRPAQRDFQPRDQFLQAKGLTI